jgi:hypothetical protein
MMFLLGVILTALAILFLLSSLAFSTAGRLRHPRGAAAVLLLILSLGLVLISE